MNQTQRYHIDNRAYRFEINNIQYSLVILVQWRGIVKRRNLMILEVSNHVISMALFIVFKQPLK